MTAAPRKRAHRTRPTGRLTPIHAPDLGLNGYCACWFRLCSVRAITKGRRLRESLPYPENIDHHVVVDPANIRLLRHGSRSTCQYPEPGTREPAVGEVVALFAARHRTGTGPAPASDRDADASQAQAP